MHKTIFVIRHAKSSWQLPVSDIERPLNERGKKDAPVMAAIFTKLIEWPLKMVSSPANRAISTAKIFKDLANYHEQIEINNSLYYGDENDYLEEIQKTSENVNSIALFGHNPKVEQFSMNVRNPYLYEVPTCAIMMFSAEVDQWTEVNWENIEFHNHFFPKET